MTKIHSYFFLFLITIMGCKSKPGQLLKIINLPNYPSGSGMASYKSNFYIVGDDAASLWQLDSNYKKIGQIDLYASIEKRIDKSIKEDIEAMAIIEKKDSASLLLMGSGSTELRQQGWEINLKDGKKRKLSLSIFYRRLQLAGIKEINIEGITKTEQGFILANRGNLNYKMNYLIFTSADFYTNQESAPITLVKFGFQKENEFLGISGLCYSYKSGHLYGTLSTEETKNSLDDGAIGSSSFFILKDVLQKQKLAAVNPNVQVDLTEIDKRFDKQKIESLGIIQEENTLIKLLLAADNDNGETTLFEVEIKK